MMMNSLLSPCATHEKQRQAKRNAPPRISSHTQSRKIPRLALISNPDLFLLLLLLHSIHTYIHLHTRNCQFLETRLHLPPTRAQNLHFIIAPFRPLPSIFALHLKQKRRKWRSLSSLPLSPLVPALLPCFCYAPPGEVQCQLSFELLR